MRQSIRNLAMVGCGAWIACAAVGCAAEEQQRDGIARLPATPLVTGRAISPDAQSSQNVGSLPVNMISVRGGRFVVCTDGGFRQALWVIRTEDGSGVSHVNFPRATQPVQARSNGLYYGLAF